VRSETSTAATPLWAVNTLTFLASIGTGVVWNGISFIAEHDYRFTQAQTLSLYVLMGVTYVLGAFSTGPVLRSIEAFISPRAALAVILLLEAAVCASIALVHADWMLWLVAATVSVLSSWQWPIVESFLTAGRHGQTMRHAIGWWNVCWTCAVATAMVLLGGLHAVALVPLMRFRAVPGSHDVSLSAAAVQPQYQMLLRAARTLLPLSYVLNAGMSPLLPYIMNDLGLAKATQTPLSSTWMWVRVAAIALMWQIGIWHGRWSTLIVGGIAMTIGFALIVSAHSVIALSCGLASFGVGMGIVYYAALYYAMAVGQAEVDAGGTHEGLIGLGYTIGPLTGLMSLRIANSPQSFSHWVVALVSVFLVLGTMRILRLWQLSQFSDR
jgi:hypothetical protein